MMSGVRHYQYDKIYPPNGKELQLDQVRALLPQYKVALEIADEVKVPMVCYQKDEVYPPSGGELQLEQVRAKMSIYQRHISCVDMEMTVCTTTHWCNGPHVKEEHRMLLCTSVLDEEQCNEPVEEVHYSIDDQLELLCADKSAFAVPPKSSAPNSEGDNDFERELKQLELEDRIPTSSLSIVQDKENRPCGKRTSECYAFTPDTADGSLNWPCTNQYGDHINTKLNFTDTESILSSSNHSHVLNPEDAKQQWHETRKHRFDVSSDLESKAKLLCDQQEWAEEFPVTEINRVVVRSEDSMSQNRRPLQPINLEKSSRDQSYSASASDFQTSFSICDTTKDDTSFIPYHDSMQASTSSFRNPPSLLQENPFQEYCAPLGAPLNNSEQCISEQTFTQFDIGHPKELEPVSTPKTHHQQKDLTMDLSIIAPDGYKLNASHAPVSRPCQLTPIKEEFSGSSKSSLSTRSTVSSVSSGNSCNSVSTDCPMRSNPFLANTVSKMINSLGGVPRDAVQVLAGPISPMDCVGQELILGKHCFNVLSLFIKGNFSELYSVRHDARTYILQVHNHPMEWEVTVLNQLHHRLQEKGLQHLCDSFQQYYQVYQLPASVLTLSMCHTLGSVQTVVDNFAAMKKVVPESLVCYLGSEMFSVVKYLHQCGIIHAAIRPSHFLLHDIRFGENVSDRARLRLIDMRRAIDTTLFPDDHVFFGGDLYLTANNIDMDNQTWKWQIDYYGLAACLLSLIAKPFNGRPMFTRENSLYTWSAKPFKTYQTSMWQDIIEKLLNAVDVLPLEQLGQPLKENACCSQDVIKEINKVL